MTLLILSNKITIETRAWYKGSLGLSGERGEGARERRMKDVGLQETWGYIQQGVLQCTALPLLP